jgi:hypothetical protein
MRILTQQPARISVPTVEGIEIFDCAEILRCEADKTSSFIYLTDGTHVLSTKSLKYFEKTLGAYDFMRVHKTNLVNILHIRKYLKGKRSLVVMTDSTLVEVSSRKKNQLLKIISAFPFTSGPAAAKAKPDSRVISRRKTKIVRAVIAAERKNPKTILVRKSKTATPVMVSKQKAS